MTVVIGVPQKGRTGIGALEALSRAGLLDSNIASGIGQIHQQEKQRIKQEAKSGHYSTTKDMLYYLRDHPLAEYLHLQSDTGRQGYPPRIVFNMAESESSEGIPLLIKGLNHYTAPQELRSHEADIIFGGWDEIYASLVDEIQERAKNIGKWLKFNSYVGKERRHWNDDVVVKGYKRTDAEIAGSAGLGDFVGHWLIFPEDKIQELSDENGNVCLKNVDRIYIDPKFAAVYNAVLSTQSYPYTCSSLFGEKQVLFEKGQEVELISAEDVEDAVIENNGVGIEIVQTASTLRKKHLVMAGYPLVESETVIAHIGQANLGEDGNKILSRLNPLDYESPERVDAYNQWYKTLSSNSGDNWLAKPDPYPMFFNQQVTVYKIFTGERQTEFEKKIRAQ